MLDRIKIGKHSGNIRTTWPAAVLLQIFYTGRRSPNNQIPFNMSVMGGLNRYLFNPLHPVLAGEKGSVINTL